MRLSYLLEASSLPASLKCAGDKINQAIADYIKKNFNLFIGDRTAEDIKIKIGSAVLVDEEMDLQNKVAGFSDRLAESGGNYHQRSGQGPLIPNLKI